MYCKKCGTKIEEDSIYCKNCGEKIVDLNTIIDKTEEIDREKGCARGIIVMAIILLITFLIIPLMNSKSCDVLSRDATNNDINIDVKTNIATMSFEMIILPNVDINSLQIEIDFKDENNILLKTVTKYVGNVKKGVQVETNIDSSDLGYSNLLKAGKTVTRVKSGKVPLI